jgi:hypothetical protein
VPTSTRSFTLAIILALPLASCDGKSRDALAQNIQSAQARSHAKKSDASRVVACTVMPLDEVNAITGESFTIAESRDDGRSPSSGCHYSTPSNPAGMSVEINWISPSDYSSEAEHLALQQASLRGAKLGGKLGSNAAGPGAGALPSGEVEGVGDEATTSMLLLTARKGDRTVMVQIIPTDMMAVMTDSTFGTAIVEKEKNVARKVLAKL